MNLSVLADLSGRWIDRVHSRRPPKGIVLDMDSSVGPTHGDLERCALRPGNVHSADSCQSVLDPAVARYRDKVSRLYFRAAAAFAMPEHVAPNLPASGPSGRSPRGFGLPNGRPWRQSRPGKPIIRRMSV